MEREHAKKNKGGFDITLELLDKLRKVNQKL